jgi:hypothetical protein
MNKKIFSIAATLCSILIVSGCGGSSTRDRADDNVAPVIGSGIVFSGTSATGTTVSWGAAADNATDSGSLLYKLVVSDSANSINTVLGADAMAEANIIMAWTQNSTSCSALGLSPNTTYYFAVIVKDAAGNMNLYTPASETTSSFADTTAPAIGSSISFSGTSATGTTVSWGAATDNVTAQANLSYKLVQASSSAAIDTVSEADAAAAVAGWTANLTSYSVSGLSAGTTYYFAVLVQDAAGNKSLYPPVSVTTSAASDTTAPTVGTVISFSSTTSAGTAVSWGAATDNVTAPTNLSYKLVQASSNAAIDTVNEVDSAAAVAGWTANMTSYSVSGLSASTTYYFAVLVQDAAGNKSLYPPVSVTTSAASDTTAPTVGTVISFSGTSSAGTTVTWGAATDNVTAQTNLSYKLVQASSSAAIDTVNEADAAAAVAGWTVNLTSYSVSGLSASTTYYFAVLVKDAAGNKSLYSPVSVTTYAATSATLVAEYKFENNGNASTGSCNLASYGSPSYSSTKKEGSYSVSFNGNSYLYNNNTSINVSSGLTVSVWINYSTDTNYNSIISLYNSNGNYYILSFAEIGNPMKALTLFDNAVNPACTTSLESGSWYHVVCTVSTDKKVSMYVNGSPLSDNDASSSNVVSTVISTISKVEIGTSAGEYGWDGFIDDVRIYNGVMSASEVSALYNSY